MSQENIEEIPGGARLTLCLSMTNGLHARPAAKLAKEAKSYQSEIKILVDGEEADAKSMLDILTLALGEGEEFTLEATGPDAKDAIRGLSGFFEQAQD